MPLAGRRYRRVAALLEQDAALYAAHIPLDLHPEVGNNVVLAERLGIEVGGWFGDYRGSALGVWGHAGARHPTREALVAEVNRALGTFAPGAKLIAGGPERVTRVGIITGGAGSMIASARDAGVHVIAWDTRDDRGRRVAPGVYLLHVVVSGASAVRRIVLDR